jgi:hypothetical protein
LRTYWILAGDPLHKTPYYNKEIEANLLFKLGTTTLQAVKVMGGLGFFASNCTHKEADQVLPCLRVKILIGEKRSQEL